MKNALVITTINPPRPEIISFAKLSHWQLICVGDRKTPKEWSVKNTIYLSPNDQKTMFKKFSDILPWNCYGRKNIGYLYAIKNNYPLIGETDDDVFPYKNYPPNLEKKRTATVLSGQKFINIYRYFNKSNAWPRGFPLDLITAKSLISEKTKNIFSPIQNSVIDIDSDFDAVYRLVSDKPVHFKRTGEFALEKKSYAPLNSQNTFFYPEAYPLLYMPSFVTPRIEDILRGYIAQRLLWEINGNLLFSYTTTYTNNRNIHNYLKDFENEMFLYLQMNHVIEILDSLSLSKDLSKSLYLVYKALAKEGMVKKEEVVLVKEWIRTIEKYS